MLRPLILNIDDDDAGRYATGRSLRHAGFDVIEAATGAGGIEAAETNNPDLVLLDIRLPDIDGFEVCRRLRDKPATAGTPVLQLSASYTDIASRVHGLENGADAYLTKPIDTAILVATINSLLRMKRAESAVRQTAIEWQATFDALGEGIALINTAGEVTRSNRSFQELDGVADLVAACFESLQREQKRQETEARVGEKTLALCMDPVPGPEGKLSGAVCVIADITRKKEFEAQIQQTARLESIGVLAGGIAHDFNNLLTGILGNSSLLLETIPPASAERELVSEIVKASESAADLTQQILAYSGKTRFLASMLDLTRVALESRSFVRRFVPGNVQLVYETGIGLPAIEADAGQMQQVMMNLIINAAESFTDDQPGTVRVTTRVERLEASFFAPGEAGDPGEYVVLEVSDTGSGMSEETKTRIFDPFFTTKFAGRGLGLSAVHGILKAHHGILRLESEPGKGTTFRLYFPASVTRESTAVQKFSKAPGVRSGAVLVVDDESVVRAFARAALESRGFRVFVASNGNEGIDVLRGRLNEIHLVILDSAMPAAGGAQVLEQLKKISPRVPVILSSGLSRAVLEEKFRGRGLAGFLPKPFTALQLIDAVEAALRN